MKFSIFSLIAIISFYYYQTYAHEGHNHDAPKTLIALKGGTIKQFPVEGKDGKKGANCFVEVVKSKMDLKIYFFDTTQKSVDAKDFQLNASAVPFLRNAKTKKENSVALNLEDKKNFYLTSFDKKGAHKFDLVLKFKGPDYCKTDEEVSFIID